ncbi:UNVERIFIED_CONTAM: Tubulin polyglutamylase ttll6 [Siphonaria sp. JEL0065]|nr:Tubulin polyglutamylase ttll6 [Siphonaria sp. JEL0065]
MNNQDQIPIAILEQQLEQEYTSKPTSPTPNFLSDSVEPVILQLEQQQLELHLEQQPTQNAKRSSTATSKKKSTPNSKKKKITINATCCKYEIVRQCSQMSGLRVVDDSEPWSIFWIDTGVSVQRVLEMEPYQKINHFPGMQEICRKDYLARNLSRLSRLLPKEYNFFPKTYILPHDWQDLKIAIKAKKHVTYIAKPDHGCQGKGIFLFRSLKAITPLKEQRMIVQMYLNKPCLIDHFKFDLRVYVLVTSVNPLRIFIHRDGLARFATERYVDPSESNLNDVCMHLTNYAINKHSSNFDYTESQDAGSKRTIESVFKNLHQRGSIKDPEELWKKIHDAIVKTCITVQPQLAMILRACFPGNRVGKAGSAEPAIESVPSGRKFKEYTGSQCFEILGFDIFLDKKLKPWVLEVNHSPSFTCDSPLDLEVKSKVIGDTFGLLNLNAMTRKKFEKVEKEKIKSRLFGPVATAIPPKSATHSKQNSNTLTKFPLSTAVSNSNLRRDSASTLSRTPSSANSISSPKPLTTPLQPQPHTSINQSAQELIDEYHATYPPSLLDSLQTYEDAHIGSFRRVFPPPDTNPTLLAKYLKCLASAKRLTPDTAATKGRKEHLQRLAQEKEMQRIKMEKWKANVNEKGVVRDGSGVVKKVTSKFMDWRTEQQMALEREMQFREMEAENQGASPGSENGSEMPHQQPQPHSVYRHQFACDVPDQMIIKHVQGRSISIPASRSSSASGMKPPAPAHSESSVLSKQNIETINTWLNEETTPIPKRTRVRPGVPKHLYRHLPVNQRGNINPSPQQASATSYSNTMFSKSVTSNTEMFPVRQSLSQRNAMLTTKRAAAASNSSVVGNDQGNSRIFDLTPIEQLSNAVGGAIQAGFEGKLSDGNGGIKIEGFIGRKYRPHSGGVRQSKSLTDSMGMSLPGYTNLARQ